MGQKYLKENAILLRLVKHHFKDFKTKATMSRDTVYWGKLQTFYQQVWPMIQTGWPPEGTFSQAQIFPTQKVVFSDLLDQIPRWPGDT